LGDRYFRITVKDYKSNLKLKNAIEEILKTRK
jgi:histidinol-phosphate/aromatic aminotransferase/cobyric acid decarboxylase-like protein